MKKLLVLLFVPALAFACGGSSDDARSASESVSARDYSHACNVDQDCVAVYDGELCGQHCGCPTAAIAASAQDAFGDATSKAVDRCEVPPPETICNCPDSSVKCVSGTCQLD